MNAPQIEKFYRLNDQEIQNCWNTLLSSPHEHAKTRLFYGYSEMVEMNA